MAREISGRCPCPGLVLHGESTCFTDMVERMLNHMQVEVVIYPTRLNNGCHIIIITIATNYSQQLLSMQVCRSCTKQFSRAEVVKLPTEIYLVQSCTFYGLVEEVFLTI